MIHKINKAFSVIYKISGGEGDIPQRGVFFETFSTLQELDEKLEDLFMMETHGERHTVILFQFPDKDTIDKTYR
jgi:hypothetical protein